MKTQKLLVLGLVFLLCLEATPALSGSKAKSKDGKYVFNWELSNKAKAIFVDGGPILFSGRHDAPHNIKSNMNLGISMIHQELIPIPEMTFYDNNYLGREPIRKNF